jgi:CRP/FNR family transcriptional regulator, cyclic AMP receptor protein
MAELLDLLARSRLFGGLDVEAQRGVGRQMRLRSYPAGQTIFARSDPAGDLYLMADGRVRLSITSAEGRELSFNYVGEGDIFGEIAALDGSPRTTDASCITPVSAYLLSRASVVALLQSSPAFAKAAVDLLCARLREVDLQFESVALHRIEARLARYVLSRVQNQPNGNARGRPVVALGMSQTELAMLLGASRPKVNAAVMMLEECGAITRDGDSYTCDCQQLEQVAELT